MSLSAHSGVREAKIILRLATPLILGQLTGVLMTFVDTVMSGRLSAEALASVAAGGAIYHTMMLFGMGVLMALSPIAAQLDGEGRAEESGRAGRQALWIAAVLSGVTIAVFLAVEPLLSWIGVEAVLYPTIMGYLKALTWGVPAMFCFLAIRFLCEGLGITRPVLYFGLVGLAVNVVGNYALIYGHFGMPALGAVGCGYATSAVFWAQLIGLLIYVHRHPRLRESGLLSRFDLPDAAGLREICRVGLPIGFTFFVEVSMFASVALLMGKISTYAVAGHQVAINVASTAFMIPLGFSLATTVRVGNAIGRRDMPHAQQAGWMGISLALGAQVLSATVLWLFPEQIARVYTTDQAVIEVAAQLLLMAAIFQLPDGVQVASAGALRGLKDTSGPMAITVIAYWFVGLPLAHWLAFSRGLGPQGLWIGIIFGLTIASVLLIARFRHLATRLSSAPAV